jgi:hypothetical protein
MKQLGKKIKGCVRSKEGMNCLPAKYNVWDGGGCRILARALAEVIKGDVWTVLDEEKAKSPEHYVVEKNGYFCDDGGCFTFENYPAYFAEKYNYWPERIDITKGEKRSRHIPTDPRVEKQLKKYLKGCLN